MGGSKKSNKAAAKKLHKKQQKKMGRAQLAQQKEYEPIDQRHRRSVTVQSWMFRGVFGLCAFRTLWAIWAYDYDVEAVALFVTATTVVGWGVAGYALRQLALRVLYPPYPNGDPEYMLTQYSVIFRRVLFFDLARWERVMAYVGIVARATSFGAGLMSPPKESKDYVDAVLVWILPHVFAGFAAVALIFVAPFWLTLAQPKKLTYPQPDHKKYPIINLRVPDGMGGYIWWFRYGWLPILDVVVVAVSSMALVYGFVVGGSAVVAVAAAAAAGK